MRRGQSELRIDDRGRVWEHGVNRKGVISGSGSVISREDAEAQVAAGESYWQAQPVAKSTEPKRPSIDRAAKEGTLRLHYTEEEILAHRGLISGSDALNQDR